MINIGNNNKIKEAVIGNNNNIEASKDQKFVLKNIIIPIVVGLVIAGIVYWLGWN